jgi:hypothetical protein
MNTKGGGLFICIKNYIACMELWTDEDSEMIAMEVKGRDTTNFSKEIVCLYRTSNKDTQITERLAPQNDNVGKS